MQTRTASAWCSWTLWISVCPLTFFVSPARAQPSNCCHHAARRWRALPPSGTSWRNCLDSWARSSAATAKAFSLRISSTSSSSNIPDNQDWLWHRNRFHLVLSQEPWTWHPEIVRYLPEWHLLQWFRCRFLIKLLLMMMNRYQFQVYTKVISSF